MERRANPMVTFGMVLWAALALLVLLGAEARGDFILWGGSILANTQHIRGELNSGSRASIVSGGGVHDFYACDASAVDMSDGWLTRLWAYDSSSVAISGGSVTDWLGAYHTSTVDMSGGSVRALAAMWSSAVRIRGGSITKSWLSASQSATVEICGGRVDWLRAEDSSAANILGGTVTNLYAYDSTTVTLTRHALAPGPGRPGGAGAAERRVGPECRNRQA
jgi:hypothetical protein